MYDPSSSHSVPRRAEMVIESPPKTGLLTFWALVPRPDPSPPAMGLHRGSQIQVVGGETLFKPFRKGYKVRLAGMGKL